MYIKAFTGVMASFILFLGSSFPAKSLNKEIEPSIECMALNIYHEARGEPELGMEAVAWVTLNRVESESYPDDICKVVYQPSQFSWTTKKDQTPYETESWEKALDVADYVLDESNTDDPTDGALYFHNRKVKPKWSRKFIRTQKIGNHIFYR